MKRKRFPYNFGLLLCIFVILTATLFPQTTLISKGAIWKYVDDGSDQSTAWTGNDFNDSTWKTGQAQLGYGDDDEATIISYGPDEDNKYATTYFRHQFVVNNPSEYVFWDMKLVRDDGAVVYLNGHEIHRVNMPGGSILYNTFANADGTDATFFPLNISQSSFQYLQDGINTIAVEIHQSSGNSSDLSFDFEFVAWDTLPPAPPLVRKEPYLIYEGKNTEMALHWQLTQTASCAVSLGTDSSYLIGTYISSEYGNDHQHKYLFTNLTPATKYYYKVIAEKDTFKNTFFSAPDTNAANVKFLAYGDSRSFPLAHNVLAATIMESFSGGYQTISIGVGDYCDDGGSEESWDNEYFSPSLTNVRKLMGSIAIQGTIGDHEYDGDGGELYRKYLPYPFVSQFGKYFSFEYGPALFISIDLYSSLAKTGAQYKWIENKLATTAKKWKFVFFHEPGWSTGEHENNTTVQNLFQPLFEKYKVAIVFTGHNHIYARGTVNGVKHVTTGGGGAPLYYPRPANENPNIETYTKAYHYCKIDIEGDVLKFTAISVDDNIIDQFTINAVTAIEFPEKEASHPKEFKLFDAYPNPFNPNTTISFSLPESSKAKLEIYDALGKLVTTAIDAELERGVYHYKWNASGLASGVYIYKLTAEQFVSSKKLVLMK